MIEQKENFAEMLEQTMKTINPGDIVVGIVTSVAQNEITLDLGAKTTGVIVHDKLTDDPQAKLDQLFKVGDEVKAKVIRVSDIEGIAVLAKLRVDSEANWIDIVAKYESGEAVREGVHLFAHSRADGKEGVAYLLVNNSRTDATTLELPKEATVYLLEGKDGLRSRVMTLNGRDLVLGENWELPDLSGAPVAAGKVELAPMTCTFLVV